LPWQNKNDELLKYIESNSDVMLDKPMIKGTRITAELIIKKISAGAPKIVFCESAG